MNLIQRELRNATLLYKDARLDLASTNKSGHRGKALSHLNRSRARLKNVIRATNVLLGRNV